MSVQYKDNINNNSRVDTVLLRDTYKMHARNLSASSDEKKSLSNVRGFVIPAQSSHSCRIIKPNKRFFEGDSVTKLISVEKVPTEMKLKEPKLMISNIKTEESSSTEEVSEDDEYFDDTSVSNSSDHKNRELSLSPARESLESVSDSSMTIKRDKKKYFELVYDSYPKKLGSVEITPIMTCKRQPRLSSKILESGIKLSKPGTKVIKKECLPDSINLKSEDKTNIRRMSSTSRSDVHKQVNSRRAATTLEGKDMKMTSKWVECGVCGTVKYYKYGRQEIIKYGISFCEQCHRFLTKMIRLSNEIDSPALKCKKGEGRCIIPSLEPRSRTCFPGMTVSRCNACWLMMCLCSLHLPVLLHQKLASLLPPFLQLMIRVTDNALLTTPRRKLANPELEEERLNTKCEEEVSRDSDEKDTSCVDELEEEEQVVRGSSEDRSMEKEKNLVQPSPIRSSGSQGTVKMNMRRSNKGTDMPGSVLCGICGALRYYRFIKQTLKFGIYCCESCRKFTTKMLRLSQGSRPSPLECLGGAGACTIPPIIRNFRHSSSSSSYKVRCLACWLMLCLRTYQLSVSTRQKLNALLPHFMQKMLDSDYILPSSYPGRVEILSEEEYSRRLENETRLGSTNLSKKLQNSIRQSWPSDQGSAVTILHLNEVDDTYPTSTSPSISSESSDERMEAIDENPDIPQGQIVAEPDPFEFVVVNDYAMKEEQMGGDEWIDERTEVEKNASQRDVKPPATEVKLEPDDDITIVDHSVVTDNNYNFLGLQTIQTTPKNTTCRQEPSVW